MPPIRWHVLPWPISIIGPNGGSQTMPNDGNLKNSWEHNNWPQGSTVIQASIEHTTTNSTSDARFRELIEGLTDTIVWEADPANLQFTFVSKGADKILDYPSEQ